MSPANKTVAGFAGLIFSLITGTISSEIHFGPGEAIAFFGGVLFLFGIYRSAFSAQSTPAAADLEVLNAIQHRITDVQEILLSLDERLKRIESTRAAEWEGIER